MEWNVGVKNLVMMILTVALVVTNGNCLSGGQFVQRQGTHFTVSGKKLYLNGFNAYWLMYM